MPHFAVIHRKKYQIPIFGYFRVFKENPQNSQICKSENRELGWEFPGWDLSDFAKFGIFLGIQLNTLKYPIMGICYFFL